VEDSEGVTSKVSTLSFSSASKLKSLDVLRREEYFSWLFIVSLTKMLGCAALFPFRDKELTIDNA
jgi:hypothetical protein